MSFTYYANISRTAIIDALKMLGEPATQKEIFQIWVQQKHEIMMAEHCMGDQLHMIFNVAMLELIQNDIVKKHSEERPDLLRLTEWSKPRIRNIDEEWEC